MKLYSLVTKDILRRKKRVLYAALGIVIGTMTVVGILTIALAGKARIYSQLEKYGPNLTVVPAINSLDMKLGDLSMGTLTVGENYISSDNLPRIRQIADDSIREEMKIEDEGNIATIAPKLYVNSDVAGISVMLVGIEQEEEIKVKTWWRIREGDYIKGPDEVMIGATAAELLKLGIDDTITLNDEKLSVTGILEETGASDDYQIFVPLATLQRAFNKEGLVSSIDIRALCNACPVEMIADEINENVTGIRAVAVKQIAASEMDLMEKMNNFMLALAGITLLVGLFGVINTMMASVNERVKDIGIMSAVGASRDQIIKIFVYEAVIIGIIGGIFGYIAGTLLAYAIGPILFNGTAISYVPLYFPLSLALAVVLSTIATLYPAYRATRIKVADLFRSL
ncbi:MAG: ABC transporter permease [Dehalococcoidia bacterium]